MEEEETNQCLFRGRDIVNYIREYKNMKNIKEAEIFDELKNMGANNSVKWIDKNIGNKNIWVLDVVEVDNSKITVDDFKNPTAKKEWED